MNDGIEGKNWGESEIRARRKHIEEEEEEKEEEELKMGNKVGQK